LPRTYAYLSKRSRESGKKKAPKEACPGKRAEKSDENTAFSGVTSLLSETNTEPDAVPLLVCRDTTRRTSRANAQNSGDTLKASDETRVGNLCSFGCSRTSGKEEKARKPGVRAGKISVEDAVLLSMIYDEPTTSLRRVCDFGL